MGHPVYIGDKNNLAKIRIRSKLKCTSQFTVPNEHPVAVFFDILKDFTM